MIEVDSVKEYLGIIIDYSRDKIIPEKGLVMLTKKGFYKKEWEDSPQESLARSSTCYCFGDYDFAQRIYDYASNGWFTNASPVLSTAMEVNWPTFTKEEFEEASDWLEENVNPEGLPISCFLSFIPDSKEGLVESRNETAWLSMLGGGISIFPSNRSPDEKSTGVMSHLKGYDADALSYKQSESRRGSLAAYMNVNHPEILTFLDMRNPTGGDINKKCFNLNNAVNIPDWFMEKMVNDEEYELVDPKHGNTGRFLKAREVWNKILDMRWETGEPYLHFIDRTNGNLPSWITKPTYNVTQSNLCSEITLMTSAKRTAVCCLSSLNLEKFDEWKDTTIVEDLVRYLDNVLEYFIRLAPPVLNRAVYSASKERAIGLGALGFHSYLQSKMIPFESGGFNSAASENYKIFSLIKERAVASSRVLAKERGEPSDCYGSGMRHSHVLAIAPNASSSDFVGTSPSIEPLSSNGFMSEGRAGAHLFKNKWLEKLFIEKGINTKETWDIVILDDGTASNIEELSEHEKSVFKTSKEINPQWIVEHASQRQPFICQSQSVNINLQENTTRQFMSDLHFFAWVKGLKTLYYCRVPKAQKTYLNNVETNQPLNHVKVQMNEIDFNDCLSCHG